jgi:hypothetical protein
MFDYRSPASIVAAWRLGSLVWVMATAGPVATRVTGIGGGMALRASCYTT